MTWTKQLVTDKHLAAYDGHPPRFRDSGSSTLTRSTSDVLGGSRNDDPASLLRPNPPFPGDEAD